MTKKQLSLILDYIETHQQAVFDEFANKEFEQDGRIKVGPDHKKLNCLRRKLYNSCGDGPSNWERIKTGYYQMMLKLKGRFAR